MTLLTLVSVDCLLESSADEFIFVIMIEINTLTIYKIIKHEIQVYYNGIHIPNVRRRRGKSYEIFVMTTVPIYVPSLERCG